MHELPIIEDILSISLQAVAEEDILKIEKIHLSASCFSGIIPEWCQLFFDMISKDTIAEGAVLDINLKPAEMFCLDCKKTWYTTDTGSIPVCPYCSGKREQLKPIPSIQIESIEALTK